MLIIFILIISISWLFLNKDKYLIKQEYELESKESNLLDSQLKEKIGQMIMMGFKGTEATKESDIYKIIKNVKIGGVSFSDYDVASNSYFRNIKSPAQTKKLIADIQTYSGIPLLVAVDVEGGAVNRLKEKYGFLSIESAENMGKDKSYFTTRNESEKIAKELKDIGFNMNLAPVVDVNINSENPIIGKLGRSFSSNSNEVFENGKIFIQNHINNNIISVVKHFPGQGSANNDNHFNITDITNTYIEEELAPYLKLKDCELLDVIMVGHLINKNIDKVYPATLSKNFLQGILRNKIGFDGVIISDDIQMSSIKDNYSLEESVILAINAGCDIVYAFNNIDSGYNEKLAYEIRDIIFNAVKNGKIKEEKINESYGRIIKLKKQFRIIKPNISEIKEQKFELLQHQTLNFSQIYKIVKNIESITKVRSALMLAISQEELNLEKKDMCYLTNFVTGEGAREIDGKKIARVMKPDRDIKNFLQITKDLGKDPKKTLVTCPMSFGWGGAMGPADFIPSTWMLYNQKIKDITGKESDPWNVYDAFLAMGLYLSDSGASIGNIKGEWDASMIYFSGSVNSGYNFYADQVLDIADKIQEDINIIENVD